MNFEPLLRRALTPGGHDLNNLKSTIDQKANVNVQISQGIWFLRRRFVKKKTSPKFYIFLIFSLFKQMWSFIKQTRKPFSQECVVRWFKSAKLFLRKRWKCEKLRQRQQQTKKTTDNKDNRSDNKDNRSNFDRRSTLEPLAQVS